MTPWDLLLKKSLHRILRSLRSPLIDRFSCWFVPIISVSDKIITEGSRSVCFRGHLWLISWLISRLISWLISRLIIGGGGINYSTSGRSRVTPHLSASGVVDPHPGTFYEFLVKRVVTPHSPGPHWGVGLPQLRLPGVVSPPVMGLQACPNLLFGENPYRRLDPKIPVMGENRDRYLFCAAWHGGHSGTGLGLWRPLVSEKNGKSVILGKKNGHFWISSPTEPPIILSKCQVSSPIVLSKCHRFHHLLRSANHQLFEMGFRNRVSD